MPALPNTIAAPTKTPPGRRLPKSQMLRKRLISLRTLSAMVTPSADVRALSRLTPRIQTYCVSALAARFKISLGMAMEGHVRSRGPRCPVWVEVIALVRPGETINGW